MYVYVSHAYPFDKNQQMAIVG